VVCLLFAAVVGTTFVVLNDIYRPAMASLFAAGLASLLSVPLAVLIPVPRHQVPQADDARPVLQRRSTKRARGVQDAPSAD
jgi:hypothetical protein